MTGTVSKIELHYHCSVVFFLKVSFRKKPGSGKKENLSSISKVNTNHNFCNKIHRKRPVKVVEITRDLFFRAVKLWEIFF